MIDAGDKSLHKDSKITEGAPVADDNNKSLLTTKKKAAKPAYLQSLNESEKQANFKIIDSMNKKIAYLKNPRFKVAKAPIIMTTVRHLLIFFLGFQRCSRCQGSDAKHQLQS